jgi:hypothetical protein
MSKATLAVSLPEKGNLDSRFGFIGDVDLRQRLCLAMEFIVFLVELQERYKLQPTIIFSINKDIVLHTSCIVEACLHYTLITVQKKGTAAEKQLLKKQEKQYKRVQRYDAISSTENVVGAIERIFEHDLGDEEKFNDLLSYAEKIGLLDAEFCTKAHYLRKKRNEIHLFALDSKKIIYNRKTINKVFNDTKDVLQHLEERVTQLNTGQTPTT